MDGRKDAPHQMFWNGIVAPAAILGLVAVNLVYHKVYWLSLSRVSTSWIVVYTTFWPMLGLILMKVGLAGWLCSWFLLSNLRQMERPAPILTGIFQAIGASGLAVFFVWLWGTTFLY